LSIGYQTSALCRIIYSVVDETAPFVTEPPTGWKLPPISGAKYMLEPVRLRSPAPADIIAWRDHLAAKYRSDLDELLSWDETTDYSASEDVASSADMLLRYVAAIVDEGGTEELRRLVDAKAPSRDEIGGALEAAEHRGFTGRFPQLLLVSKFWLPFQRNTIIKEPDWQGNNERFGSSLRLADEVRELRDLIRAADPRSIEWTREREVPTMALWAAWQASETLAHIATAAVSQRLPLLTTG
jgi:hypothetical protein